MHNQVGKHKFTCSCGTKAALDLGEAQEWFPRHAATNPTVKHELDDHGVIGVDEAW